jgi:hypothetical protein
VANGIEGTELFPIYALTVIVLGVTGMTVILTIYQRWSVSEQLNEAPQPSSPA